MLHLEPVLEWFGLTSSSAMKVLAGTMRQQMQNIFIRLLQLPTSLAIRLECKVFHRSASESNVILSATQAIMSGPR